ncbi:MAG TPA: nucleotidyltransferase family protein, partial [Steroidobacteraceae bacterium]|nr:nucleotidyltransferase family protein [Steroidobacteraceae bacterium]
MRAEQQRNTTQALLVRVLQDPSTLRNLATHELDLALRLLRRARLLGRVAAELTDPDRARLPETAREQLESASVLAAARTRAALWELDRVVYVLRLHGVGASFVALKGCAYATLGTPNAPARLLADVDLLVPEAELTHVESVLHEHGWEAKELTPYDERYYRRWAHELPPLVHVERGVEVDLHHNLLMRTARRRPRAELLFGDVRPLPGLQANTLAPIDMVLHAIVHLFEGGEMDDAVRELVDIDQLLRHFAVTEPQFWERFWPRASELDLARPAFYGLRYAQRLLGTPVPEAVFEAARASAPSGPTRGLMDWLVPRALFPRHPDRPDRAAAVARWLL